MREVQQSGSYRDRLDRSNCSIMNSMGLKSGVYILFRSNLSKLSGQAGQNLIRAPKHSEYHKIQTVIGSICHSHAKSSLSLSVSLALCAGYILTDLVVYGV
jgi:hypothetical protein